MSQPKRLYDRIDHGWSGHPWASRDWQDIDCNAIACKWNRDRKCSVPALAVIGNDGRCKGFVANIAEREERA